MPDDHASAATFAHDIPFGATIDGDRVRFRLWAPDCKDGVTLELEGKTSITMRSENDEGCLVAEVPGGAGLRYWFRTHAVPSMPDPASRYQPADVNGPSMVIDPRAYVWTHADWRGRPWHEAIIYELHVGSCGGYAGVMERLPALKELGITVVELMPVNAFPGRHNWGYDGVMPYAPDSAYGTPNELKALVDAAHGLGLMIFLDVVYNHFGPDGNYLHAYAERFFRDDIQSPWGAGIDFRRPQVQAFYRENALYWLREYRFDGLRFDAVSHISEPDFLDDIARAVRAEAEATGRHIHLTIEHENNCARHLAPGLFDAQWTDDWHHCAHVLLTGETEGYYEDYADATRLFARCLAEGFAYQGEVSKHMGKERGEPSGHLPPTSFVVFLQNHDQIGNRALGERLHMLADPRALAAATALLLLSPTIPLIFMGDEFGADTPFLFFTDHNVDLAKLVRDGRRKEFGHFAAFSDPARRDSIPDPNAVETFERSRPDPSRGDPATAALYRDLLALRTRFITPRIPGARSEGAEVLAPGAVRAMWRLGDGSLLTIAVNFADTPAPIGAVSGELLYGTGDRQYRTVPEGALDAMTTVAYLAEPNPGGVA